MTLNWICRAWSEEIENDALMHKNTKSKIIDLNIWNAQRNKRWLIVQEAVDMEKVTVEKVGLGQTMKI